MAEYKFRPLTEWNEIPVEEMRRRAAAFADQMGRRRTVRDFADRPLPRDLIENCLRAAGSAPSGANMQPWHFAVVTDKSMKSRIREAAEKVEKEFYSRRAPEYWLKDLEALGTNEQKEHLDKAAALIVIFARKHEVEQDGSIQKHYYINESVGIATGMLITAVHNAGLVCLTHTPSPMAFLRELLKRPKHETPFLLLAVGYPDSEAKVPDIKKKSVSEISTFFD
ncbi:MAG: nitroreductase family protein [bacterium]|nr:nitroreductase family protein [bacterium]